MPATAITVPTTEAGARLRELREAAGLTQSDLAEKARMGQAYISKLEKGTRPLSGDAAIRLGIALDVGLELAELVMDRFALSSWSTHFRPDLRFHTTNAA